MAAVLDTVVPCGLTSAWNQPSEPYYELEETRRGRGLLGPINSKMLVDRISAIIMILAVVPSGCSYNASTNKFKKGRE